MQSISGFGANSHFSGDAGLIDPILESHRRILETSDLSYEISLALARVGQASEVDRVYVFEVTALSDGTHTASQRFEWARPGVSPQLDNPELQGVPLEASGYGRWIRLLLDYQPVFGLVEDFPAEEQPLLAAQSILSLLVVPVFAAGGLWGFVGFDDCHRTKVWTRSDIDLLLALSISIGARLAPTDDPAARVDENAANFVDVVRSLIKLRDVAGSRQPLSDMLEHIRARIRAVVSIHRYLHRAGADTGIDAAEFIDFWEDELRRSLDDCGQRDLRLRAMAESFTFPVELILETALVIHELVLAYACTQGSQARRGGISVGMHQQRGTAVIRLRLEGSETADDAHPAPDPLGLVLVRRVAQALAGHLEVPATDAAAQLIIPLGGAVCEEEV